MLFELPLTDFSLSAANVIYLGEVRIGCLRAWRWEDKALWPVSSFQATGGKSRG